MILAHERDVTERYFVFSEGWKGADKNEFISRFTVLQPHLHVQFKKWK